ncbi:ubiquitin carboxyl-terminal hydrolase 16-like [Anneissia japonica]|uniref:ubiquitin carboxyl-terminal hydrolase 16-like n=1 Tax=Anneissia japonica TaxID=1529436 RepID=UPI0014255FDF|nr:ubiquitin carboxyl-terminal hydrolase 16-like [Anneissia japonica]XP_033111829.1 ubiquitin carboxyl-terminal hydrolase 16-like [Anneissia japonica]XP_033111836.1 ubiquitin carboxyl-terminal hydrolase 16-like [Anneissia japonica]
MRIKSVDEDIEMGKKRKKSDKICKDRLSSDEEAPDSVIGCEHVAKAVSQSQIRKTLKNAAIGACVECTKDKSDTNDAESCQEAGVWLCLACGYQGCGRYSTNQHALKHYNTPHSGSHSLTVNIYTWVVWCYECDKEVPQDAHKKLEECLQFVNKQMRAISKVTPSMKKKKQESKPEDGALKKTINIGKTDVPVKVKGLSNLGNTCFFNAVMQILNQTYVLKDVLDKVWMAREITIPYETKLVLDIAYSSEEEEELEDQSDKQLINTLKIHLPEGNPLTQALALFFNKMRDTSRSCAVNPRDLFNKVCDKASRFKGYQQQDSHELLRYLLDGMKNEEFKRMKDGILASFNMKRSMKPDNVDSETRAKIKNYGTMCKHTFVDSVFGGYLISAVHCQKCKQISEVHEAFLDLSLPISEAKIRKPTLLSMADEKQNKKEDKPSKHQINKAKKQARKQAKCSKKGSGNKNEEESHGNNQSENETDHCNDNYDPNDADSETSLDPRLKNKMDKTMDPGNLSDVSHLDIPARIEDNSKHLESKNAEESSSQAADIELVNKFSNLKLYDEGNSSQPNGYSAEMESEEDPVGKIKLVNDLTSTSDAKHVEQNTSKEPLSNESDDLNISKNSDENNAIEEGNNVQNTGATGSPANEAEPSNGMDDSVFDEGDDSEASKSSMACGGPEKQQIVKRRSKSVSSMRRYEAKTNECSVQTCLQQFTLPELLTGSNRFGCEICTEQAGTGKTVYQDASKQMLIQRPPSILTLHIKRFMQNGFNLRKVTRQVDFPLMLDLAPFCSTNCCQFADSKDRVMYALYGVVEHSGRLHSGHYTAYVKVRASNPDLLQYTLSIPQSSHKKNQANSSNGNPKMNNNSSNHNANAVEHSPTAQDSNKINGETTRDTDTPPKGKWFYVSDSQVTEVAESKVLKAQAYILFYEFLNFNH